MFTYNVAILALKNWWPGIIIADRALVMASKMFGASRIHDDMLISQNQ